MSDCIIWNGLKWAQGRYGMDTLNGKSMGAHRAAWIRKKGPIPNGLIVCHKCDNGLCINIDHLFLGTHKDNMQDCIAKGRFSTTLAKSDQKGENNWNAGPRLKERNKKIKEDRNKGMTYSELKKKFNIKSNGHLRSILKS